MPGIDRPTDGRTDGPSHSTDGLAAMAFLQISKQVVAGALKDFLQYCLSLLN